MSPDAPDVPADSAGVPWAGRTLQPSPFAGDDGSADPTLQHLVRNATLGPAQLAALAAALPGQRLFAPVMATLAQVGAGVTGLAADKQADMALVSVHRPDGRRALPLFTSVEAVTDWHTQARPIPVEARRAALAAIDDGCQLLLLDPDATQQGVQLPRPAVWALAQGTAWTPAVLDDELRHGVAALADHLADVVTLDLRPATEAEVEIVVQLRPGLDRAGVDAVTRQLGEVLASSSMVAERIDSIRLALR